MSKEDGLPQIDNRPEPPEMNPPYEWSWDELENHMRIFDAVEVNYWDGKKRKMFGAGDSGTSVLRVTNVTPQKTADGKVILHISTDSQWFTKERVQLMADSTLEKLLADERLKALEEAKATIDGLNLKDPYGRQAWYAIDKLIPESMILS